ncbi:MAG: DUF4907 domain-containing protein [Cytophagaceae bacterium]
MKKYLTLLLPLLMACENPEPEAKTTIRTPDDSMLMQPAKPFIDPDSVTSEVFKTESGWGYNILLSGKNFIHQPHIPAVSGARPFQSADDAEKAAELVKYKIQNNIMPPSVTVMELDSLGIAL